MHTQAIDIGAVEPDVDAEIRLGQVAGSAVSLPGKRRINADAVATFTDHEVGRSAFVVADGIGDHLAAARAARLVARVAARVAVRDGARAGILAAQQELLRELPEKSADSVLVVAVLPSAGNLDAPCDIAWVGDCRVYRYNGRVLHRVTTDHTVAEYFRARGHDPLPGLAHLVTSSARTARPEDIGHTTTGSSTGRLLLCTDGVGKRLNMPTIKSILADGTSPKTTAEALVQAALATGGTDNTTALIVDAHRLP
ncbi:PP2C family protein-serine/threonine phosphatase [Nocardia sp. NPDC059240]|uniref:PP2C family protein-serine/threonine phosphatase n=1 Tax=Nocardia sp. NPDC059240 TaxID=3346786 RepID=UPI0036D1F827